MPSEKIAPAKAQIYRKKALEFERAMEASVEAGDANATALNAIHAAISAAVALTAFYLGERSRGPDHRDVTRLIQALDLADAKDRASQLLDILRIKNEVEYEARDFDPRSADRVRKQAGRFVAWMKTHVPG